MEQILMMPPAAPKTDCLIWLRNIEKCFQTKAGEIMDLFKKLNLQGTTLVQVTRNESWAAYSQRIVRLRGGWTVK